VLVLACGDDPRGSEGSTSAPVAVDADGDGVVAGVDCDDGDPAVFPGAAEVWYDGVDQDCLGDDDFDQDGDTDRRPVDGGLDCDDSDAAISSLVVLNADMGRLMTPTAGDPLSPRFSTSPVVAVSEEDAADDQHHTTVTWGADGRVAATWQSGSGTAYDALFVLLDGEGREVLGSRGRVNDTATKGGKPDVEARVDGYVVAYEGGTSPLFLRAINLDGEPLGAPVLAFDDATEGVFSEAPDLALFDDGSGVLVWVSIGGVHGEGVHYVQRFAADLALVGEPLAIKAAGRSAADIAALPGAPGGFVVTGTVKDLASDQMQVYAVKVGADGCRQEIRGDQGESDAPSRPAVAVDAQGRMALTWRSKVEAGLGEGSYGRFFEASGQARSDSFSLASADEDGNRSVVAFWGTLAVFAWQGIVAGDQEDAAYAIYDIESVEHVFSEDVFNVVGEEPEIDAQRPSIAIRDAGDGTATLVVTWESEQMDPTAVSARFVALETP
jgi:hypothetical protein